METAGNKICRACEIPKDIEDFWVNRLMADGRYNECKACAYEKQKVNLQKRLEIDPLYSVKRQREWRQRGRNDFRRRIKKNYGMTVEEYDKLLAEQENKCALCGSDFEEGKRIAVDHDHGTGKIRSLLHLTCNSGLGLFLDSPDICRKAAIYLERHKEIDLASTF